MQALKRAIGYAIAGAISGAVMGVVTYYLIYFVFVFLFGLSMSSIGMDALPPRKLAFGGCLLGAFLLFCQSFIDDD